MAGRCKVVPPVAQQHVSKERVSDMNLALSYVENRKFDSQQPRPRLPALLNINQTSKPWKIFWAAESAVYLVDLTIEFLLEQCPHPPECFFFLLCNFPGETFQDTLSFPAAQSRLPGQAHCWYSKSKHRNGNTHSDSPSSLANSLTWRLIFDPSAQVTWSWRVADSKLQRVWLTRPSHFSTNFGPPCHAWCGEQDWSRRQGQSGSLPSHVSAASTAIAGLFPKLVRICQDDIVFFFLRKLYLYILGILGKYKLVIFFV